MDEKFKFLFIGLAIGLVVAIIVYAITAIKASGEKKKLFMSNEKYKETLASRMDIESEGLNKLKTQVEELKKENENLRVALNIASSKPDAREVARASILQHAVDKVMASSVGFAGVWTKALEESEAEYQDKVLTGKVPFFKRIFSRQGFRSEGSIASSSGGNLEDKSEG